MALVEIDSLVSALPDKRVGVMAKTRTLSTELTELERLRGEVSPERTSLTMSSSSCNQQKISWCCLLGCTVFDRVFRSMWLCYCWKHQDLLASPIGVSEFRGSSVR